MTRLPIFPWLLLATLLLVRASPTYYLDFGAPRGDGWHTDGALGSAWYYQFRPTADADVVKLRGVVSQEGLYTIFYTLDDAAAQYRIDRGWHEFDCDIAVYKADGPGRVAVHAFSSTTTNVQMYSTAAVEVAAVQTQQSFWTYQGVVWWLPPAGDRKAVTLSRYRRD